MKIERVYLAGGINGLNDSDAYDWRNLAKELLPREIGVVDPMARDYRGVEDQNVKAIVDGDLADIESCQAIIAYCPRPSWGTAMELCWNYYNRAITEFVPPYVGEMGEQYGGKPAVVGYRRCVAIVPHARVSPWLRHHTDALVHDLDEAVAQIVKWSA